MKHFSVYPNGNKKVWYAAFPDPKTGKRTLVATEFRRDDPQGKRKALNWVRTHAAKGIANLGENKQANWALWVQAWISLKYRSQAKTLAKCLNQWSWLHAYLVEATIETPRALGRSGVMAYLDWRMQQKNVNGNSASFNTALAEVKLLSRVVDEAKKRGFADENPAEKLGLKKDKAAEKPEITDAEIKIILEALNQLEGQLPLKDRWMTISFKIALHQGCRQAATAMPLSRIDLVRGTIQFHEKRNQIFTTMLHPDLRPLIEQLKADGATVTCTLPRMVGKIWHWFFKGRHEKDRDTPGVMPHLCFHCTRVTVITRFARRGVPIQQAMAFVHHADALIHQIYQRLKPEDAALCVAALEYPKGNDA